jgi:dTDP-4-dehydrorhamnose reductase
MTTILLFGKGGQVGWELQRSLAPLGELVALDFDSQDFCGDFTNLAGLAETVKDIQPDVIVNAAAHTAVDKAQSEPELARTINALAPGVLATAAAAQGACMVHYSTDYVFDGSGTRPWTETDAPAPLNVYGQTKLEGEQRIAASGCAHLIFRTSWVYAARGGNFAKTILKLARQRESLQIIDDQIGAPTSAELLADVTAHAIRQLHGSGAAPSRPAPPYGIYNLAAAGQTSWFEYANTVFDIARQLQPAIDIAAKIITPVASSAFPTPAARPLNSRLDTRKLQATLGLALPHWKQGVRRMLTEYIEKQA